MGKEVRCGGKRSGVEEEGGAGAGSDSVLLLGRYYIKFKFI